MLGPEQHGETRHEIHASTYFRRGRHVAAWRVRDGAIILHGRQRRIHHRQRQRFNSAGHRRFIGGNRQPSRVGFDLGRGRRHCGQWQRFGRAGHGRFRFGLWSQRRRLGIDSGRRWCHGRKRQHIDRDGHGRIGGGRRRGQFVQHGGWRIHQRRRPLVHQHGRGCVRGRRHTGRREQCLGSRQGSSPSQQS